MTRPAIGTTTTREIRVPICKLCGCEINEVGECDQDCEYDCVRRPKGTVLTAVYQRTDVLVREES